MNFDIIVEKFNSIEIISDVNSFEKVRVSQSQLLEVLSALKNFPEYDFDRLNSIIAIDLDDSFELIYDLYSTFTNQMARVSVISEKNAPKINSVIQVYESAYFDECEIYDMFGVYFLNNPRLKRLYMPKGWIGHPLRKDYVFEDKRLDWGLKDA